MCMHKLIGFNSSLACAILLAVGTAAADWDPGDGHKMHFPQLPDPGGLDVRFNQPVILADDWRCSETGPVTDVHFWFSSEMDQPYVIQSLRVSIHSDVPAKPGSFSHPGDLLWERDFTITPSQIRGPFLGQQGWFDPSVPVFRFPDHEQFWQLNLEGIVDPFIQQLGTIYWLDLSVVSSAMLGWKTSLNHFNDDAVWSAPQAPLQWNELRDPRNGESLDLAFVITPEPASITLLLLGAAGCLVRRQRR